MPHGAIFFSQNAGRRERFGSRSPRLLALLLACLATWLFDASVRPASALGILSCSYAMTNEAFGNVDVLPGAAVSTSAILTITCDGLSVLQNVYSCVSFPTPRTMTGPSSLSYDLLGPPPQTTSWSNTTPIVFAVPVLGGSTTVAVNATLFGGQTTAIPGGYSQSLTATVNYGLSSCTSGQAKTATFNVTTTATVDKSCNVSATNLAFGSVGDLTSAVDGQSQVDLQCSNQVGYTVALNGGLSNATNPAQRLMTAGSESVTYGLYRNAARSLPWGSSVGSNVVSGTGNAGTQTLAVYGRVPVQATPSPATYSDTVTVSVAY